MALAQSPEVHKPVFLQGSERGRLLSRVMADLVDEEVGGCVHIGNQPVSKGGCVADVHIESLPANAAVAHPQANATIFQPCCNARGFVFQQCDCIGGLECLGSCKSDGGLHD